MKRLALLCCFVLSSSVFLSTSAPAQESSTPARKIVSRVSPQYPPLARTMNLQGNVRVDVLVAPNGTVKSVEVKGGHPLLGQAAQNAIREWKWEAGPHETHEIIELKFTL
jgi:TonB family protein